MCNGSGAFVRFYLIISVVGTAKGQNAPGK
jgi:hypothetical protein